MKVAICDDVMEVCSDLERILLDLKKEKNMYLTVDVFSSGEELMEELNNVRYDLIFLDIELIHMNGVEVGQYIRKDRKDHITKIVYISSKTQYDRQLFDVQPLLFLEKPIKQEKVNEAVRLTKELLGEEKTTFTFKKGQNMYHIPLNEILYFEVNNRTIGLVKRDEILQFNGKIKDIHEEVKGYRFMHPHRSYVVNYDHISLLKPDRIEMVNGDIIPITIGKREEVKRLHFAFSQKK